MTDQWAAILWQRFKDLYGQKWISLFAGDDEVMTWRSTWASGLHFEAEQIKHGLSLLGTEFPEWPPTFGQFKALCASMPKAYVALPPPAKIQPSVENSEKLHKAILRIANRTGKYWTPEVVRNAAQVDRIVQQANRFGENSAAGRFLAECKAFGCITSDNQFRLMVGVKVAA